MKLIIAIAFAACLLAFGGSSSLGAWSSVGKSACRQFPLIKVYQADNIHYKWRLEYYCYERGK